MKLKLNLIDKVEIIQNRVCQHLRRSGFPKKESARFSSLFVNWIVTNGPQWAVDHIKQLDVFVRSRLANPKNKSVWEFPKGWGYSKSRSGIKFRDRFIQSIFCSDLTKQQNLVKIKSLLRITDFLVHKEPTSKQILKAKTAITGPSTLKWKDSIILLHERIEEGMKDVPTLNSVPYVFAKPIYGFLGNTKTFPVFINRPLPHNLFGLRDYLSNINNQQLISIERNRWQCLDDMEFLLQHDTTMQYLTKHFRKEMCERIFGSEQYDYTFPNSEIRTDFPLGKLVILQERGLKPRYVTSVHAVYQATLEILKKQLERVCKQYYSDKIYTFNQIKGIELCKSWLSSGCVVTAVDQSSFTDRFPLTLQNAVLQTLANRRQISHFDLLAFKLIITKSVQSDELGNVNWSCGQPMGLGPSFHLACLTHCVLLDYIKSHYGVTGDFAIVGDDIIINNPVLAHLYVNYLEDLGVDVNPSKGLISPSVSDFLGHWITERGPVMVSHPNARNGEYPSDPIAIRDHMKYYGPKVWNKLSYRSKQKALLCVLPKSLNGLGWKPNSMSYTEYLSYFNISNIVYKLEATFANQLLDEQIVDPTSYADAIMNKTEFLFSRLFVHSSFYRDLCAKVLETSDHVVGYCLQTGNFEHPAFLQFLDSYFPNRVEFNWLTFIPKCNPGQYRRESTVNKPLSSFISIQENIDRQILKAMVTKDEHYSVSSIRLHDYSEQLCLFKNNPDMVVHSTRIVRDSLSTIRSGKSKISKFTSLLPLGIFHGIYDRDLLNNTIINPIFINNFINQKEGYNYVEKFSHSIQQSRVGEIQKLEHPRINFEGIKQEFFAKIGLQKGQGSGSKGQKPKPGGSKIGPQ